jgi:hypothetical protein
VRGDMRAFLHGNFTLFNHNFRWNVILGTK